MLTGNTAGKGSSPAGPELLAYGSSARGLAAVLAVFQPPLLASRRRHARGLPAAPGP